MKSMRGSKAAGYCNACRKFLYYHRSDAKKVMKLHSGGGHMNTYRCPAVPTMFHIGHLAQIVVDGDASRSDIYREAS